MKKMALIFSFLVTFTLTQSVVAVDYGAFKRAIESGNSKKVKKFIKEKKEFVQHKYKNDFRPIHIAVLSWCKSKGKNEYQQVIQVLLDNGASPNVLTASGRSPIHILFFANAGIKLTKIGDILKMLLDKGADINISRKGMNPPIYTAVADEKRGVFLAKILLDNGAKDEGVIFYILNPENNIKKRLDLIKLFLLYDKGLLKARDENDDTPLHFACKMMLNPKYKKSKKEYENIVKFLIDQKADVSALDFYKRTVLHLLVEHAEDKDLAVVKYIIGKGVDKNGKGVSATIKTPSNETLLHNVNSEKVAKYLVKAGVDVNAKDNFEKTPLSNVNNIKIAKYLVKKGAKITTGDYMKYFFPRFGSAQSNHGMAKRAMKGKKGAELEKARKVFEQYKTKFEQLKKVKTYLDKIKTPG